MATSTPMATAQGSGPSRERHVDTTKRTRRRKTNRSGNRDPLTSVLSQIAAVPLFVGLALLHTVYYVYLRLLSFARRHEGLAQDRLAHRARQLREDIVQRVRPNVALWFDQNAEIEQQLLEYGNERRRRGELTSNAAPSTSVAGKKKAKVAPPMAHFALCLGPKTTKTHELLGRAVVKVSHLAASKLGRAGSERRSTQQRRRNGELDDLAGHLQFALDNARAALKYCAMADVPEVTIFDERGLLREALESRKVSLDIALELTGYEPARKDDTSEHAPAQDNAQSRVSQVQQVASYDNDVASPRTPRSRASSISGGAAGTSSSDDETALTDDSRQGSISGADKEASACEAHAKAMPSTRLHIKADVRFPLYDGERKSPSQVSYRKDFSRDREVTVRVNILSKRDSKAALAHAATSLAQAARQTEGSSTVAARDVQRVLEESFIDYPREPDVVVVHGGPRHVSTLHGFPPWLVKLCEIVHDVDAQPDAIMSASTFMLAMRRYMGAEQRFGK